MRTFSIRLDEELFQKLESARNDNPRADYIREVLISHFTNLTEPQTNLKMNLGEHDENLSEPDENPDKELDTLKIELTHKEQIIKIMGDRVKDLQNHNGFLISEFTRLSKINEQLYLPPPQPEPSKKWYEFWKN